MTHREQMIALLWGKTLECKRPAGTHQLLRLRDGRLERRFPAHSAPNTRWMCATHLFPINSRVPSSVRIYEEEVMDDTCRESSAERVVPEPDALCDECFSNRAAKALFTRARAKAWKALARRYRKMERRISSRHRALQDSCAPRYVRIAELEAENAKLKNKLTEVAADEKAKIMETRTLRIVELMDFVEDLSKGRCHHYCKNDCAACRATDFLKELKGK